MTPGTLFFDIGGVLLSNGWDHHARERAVRHFELDATEFESRHELVAADFETGRLSLEAYLHRTVFHQDRPFSREAFRDFMFAQSQAHEDALELARTLARAGRYLIASLNNESLELNEYRIRRFELDAIFTVFISSCYLGVRKPDEAIYRKALQITQRPPENCVFIDDRALNLECAALLGLSVIRFRDVASLRRELAALGVATPHPG
jgi:putative hydrolase of the HAD superfamily